MRSLRVGVIVCLLCCRALADDDPSVDMARRHYQSASAYFEEGKFDDAIREFRESYRLSHRVDLLFNIGQAFLRKGDSARAIDAYEEYLWGRPSSPDKAAIEVTLAKLRKQVGRVKIEGAPAGASVTIDGFAVGVAPLGKVVLATVGKRVIGAAPADGSAIRKIEVTVLPEVETTALIPTPQENVVVREKVVVQEKLVEVTTRRWFESGPGWALSIGGVLVGAVMGGTLLGLARPTASDASKATTEQAYLSLRDKAFALQGSGIAMLVVGGVVLLTGVALFVVKSRERARPVTAWIAPTVGGLVAGGTF